MGCFSDNTVAEFVEGLLEPHAASLVQEHLDSCRSCRELVSELARGRDGAAREEPGAIVGRYQIREHLGSGGMGAVYAAYDPELDREVALKMLHRPAPDRRGRAASLAGLLRDDEAGARLLREAQAIARLSDPNVVAVHDVGTLEGQVFIAMELVRGQSLDRWLAARPRERREIVGVFVQAGRGLAAAHRRGLVHRDVKPANILVGDDGRVRMSDFGLARGFRPRERADEDTEDADHEAGGEADLPGPPAPVDRTLTRTGQLVGTPYYMAPEQHLGRPADARSDQFSFCVALYQALTGSLPFAGESLPELRAAVLAGVPQNADRCIPRGLRAAIRRGLARDPADRFASMGALLGRLERDRRAIVRLTAAAVVAAAAAAGLAATLTPGREAEPCRDAAGNLRGAWDDATRSAGRAGFSRAAPSFGADAWSGVEQSLARYAGDWVAMRTEACEATRIRGEQSDRVMALRMACLDRRLEELRDLVGIFAGADRDVVARAGEAASSLPPLSPCADVEALTARVPPPADPVVRAEVDKLDRLLSSARAEFDAGRFAEAGVTLHALLPAVRLHGYRPLEGESLYLLGRLEGEQGPAARAADTLREAAWAAEAGRDDRTAALAWIMLVQVVGYDLEDAKRGQEMARQAAAAVERLDGDAELRAALAGRLGLVAEREGRFEEALARSEEAHALLERVRGPRSTAAAAALGHAGNALVMLGRWADAEARLTRALEIREAALGPSHPDVALALVNLGNARDGAGKPAEALAAYERALAIYEKVLGPDHPRVAATLFNAALALENLGQTGRALAFHRRALAIQERALGPEHTQVAQTLAAMAALLDDAGRHGEAADHLARAIAIARRGFGEEHPYLSHLYNLQGRALHAVGRHREALDAYRRAVAIAERSLPKSHPRRGYSLSGMGDAYAALGQNQRAIGALEAARAHLAASEQNPLDVADVSFRLARLMWRARPRERARALELAEGARRAFSAGGARGAERAGQVTAWLARRTR